MNQNYFWKIKDFLAVEKKKSLSYIASKDGKLYGIHESHIGRFVVPATNVLELDEIQTGFQFGLPKIPGEILETILSFFRSFISENREDEVMCKVYFNVLTKKYYVYVPKQTVNKCFVHYENDKVLMRHCDTYKEVMQIHSHNSMQAFFSSTDNADEQFYLLYAVAGELNKDEPSVRIRVGTNGGFMYLPLNAIFSEFDLSREREFPLGWKNKVTLL